MKKFKLLVALGLCGLVLGACGEKAVEEKGTAKPVEQVEKAESSSDVAESKEELGKDVVARSVYDTDWNEEWHDTKFSIKEVSIVETSDKDVIEYAGGKFLLGVNFEVKNDGDHTISTYPDQGIAIINGKQYNADMLVSESVGGDVVHGSMIEGMVVFAVPDLKSVDELKEVRVTWSANDFEDTSDMDDTTKDFDVTLELNK